MTPKTKATATIAVTFGKKYNVLNNVLNFTKVEFNKKAITSAKIIIGMVDISQMIIVLVMDFQNTGSVINNSKLRKPINLMSPIPSQLERDKYKENSKGYTPKIKKSIKKGEINK